MEKTCFKCGKTKDIECFYSHPKTRDRHLNKCKECAKNDCRRKNFSAERKVRANKYNKDWKKRNPRKLVAESAAYTAIKSGKLVRKPCAVCGKQEVHAHHENYEKPLDVVWYCVDHHAERHSEMRKLGITP